MQLRTSGLLVGASLALGAIGGVAATAIDSDEDEEPVSWNPALVMPTGALDDWPTTDMGNWVVPEGAEAQVTLEVEILGVPPQHPYEELLPFTVRLHNRTDEDIRLEPCPFYRLVIGDSASIDVVHARLPCDEIEEIESGEHADFEMQITPTENAGDVGIVWQLWGQQPDNGGAYEPLVVVR